MDEQGQDDLIETIYNCSVPIQDISLKTARKQWTMETGGERGSGRSVLAARHDDDDDVWLSNRTQSQAMLNVSAHQQP